MIEERRRTKRRRTFYRGTILHTGRSVSLDCTVRDVSVGGARIEVQTDVALPETFELAVPQLDFASRPVRIVWTRNRDIGVHFEPAEPADTPSRQPRRARRPAGARPRQADPAVRRAAHGHQALPQRGMSGDGNCATLGAAGRAVFQARAARRILTARYGTRARLRRGANVPIWAQGGPGPPKPERPPNSIEPGGNAKFLSCRILFRKTGSRFCGECSSRAQTPARRPT